MARFAGGDDQALGTVYDLAAPAVFTFLSRLARDSTLAEDLTQETFLRLHRARGLYRPGAPVLPWAYTIARRLFLDAIRVGRKEGASRSTTPGRGQGDGVGDAVGWSGQARWDVGFASASDAAAPGLSAEEILGNVELAAAVNDALARLPEAQASAFRLLKGEGLSVAEAAAIMGTTKGAVKLRAHRAYQALRGMLAGHFSGARIRNGRVSEQAAEGAQDAGRSGSGS